MTHIPPGLLVPYVTVAAREATEGRVLSPRSRWAVDDAVAQLRSDQEALSSSSGTVRRRVAVSRAALLDDDSAPLGDLILDEEHPLEKPEAGEEHFAERLGEIADDLESMAVDGDDASTRTLALFERLGRALMPAGPVG